MSNIYGVYTPYVGNLIDCGIEPAHESGQAPTIRGLTSVGEFILCQQMKIYYFSFESVKKVYASILAAWRGYGLQPEETMTDEDVAESFITGIFFERGKGRLWSTALVCFDPDWKSLRVSVYREAERYFQTYKKIEAVRVKQVKQVKQ